MSVLFNKAFVKWLDFVDRSPLRKLGHDALIAATVALGARLVGFYKEILVAIHFGLSNNLDVYFVAFVLIGFPLAIVINAIQSVFIAKLSVQNSIVDSQKLLSATMLGTVLILILILPIWLWLIPYSLPWVTSGFSLEKKQALELALIWLIPYYFLNGVNLLGYGVLQARKKFFLNGLLPVTTPLVIMAVILLSEPSKDWHTLTVGLVLGVAMECLLLMITLQRMRLVVLPKLSEGYVFYPIINSALLLAPATLIGAIVMLVEQSIAASMTEGSNATLIYGLRLPVALQGLFVTAIGITALPYFASLINMKQFDYCLHSFKKLFLILGVSGFAIALPLLAFSTEITRLLYQRGVFDELAVARVAPIQAVYFTQIPFALLAMLGIKTLAALGRNLEISLIILGTGILQCFVAYELTKKFEVVGIPLGATAASAFVALISYFSVQSILKRHIT